MLVISVQSSFRDRTQEFHSIAESLKKPSSSGSSPNRRSEFNIVASQIRHEIDQTSQKLAMLAELLEQQQQEQEDEDSWCQCCWGFSRFGGEVPKRSSDFDDHKKEIQELTGVIKNDIAALKFAVVDLLCNSMNDSGNISTDAVTHSNRVVSDLNKRLMSAENEFNIEVLAMQTEVEEESQPLLQQQRLAPLQDSYRQSRAEAIQNIESTINELSKIVEDLAKLISIQGEIAIRIDENMDDTEENIKGAEEAFLEHLKNIPSDKWLMFKIFSLLIFFLMFFLIFVA